MYVVCKCHIFVMWGWRYVDTCMCMYMQTCVHTCRSPRLTLGTNCSPPYLLRSGSSLSLGLAVLASLARQLALGIPCLHLVYLEYIQTTMPVWLDAGSEDVNSGPRGWATSTVSAEPPSQPQYHPVLFIGISHALPDQVTKAHSFTSEGEGSESPVTKLIFFCCWSLWIHLQNWDKQIFRGTPSSTWAW